MKRGAPKPIGPNVLRGPGDRGQRPSKTLVFFKIQCNDFPCIFPLYCMFYGISNGKYIALHCFAIFAPSASFWLLLLLHSQSIWAAFGPGPSLMGRLRPFVTGIHKGGFCLVYFTFCSPSPPPSLNPPFPILLRHFISLLTPAPSSLAKYRNFTEHTIFSIQNK